MEAWLQPCRRPSGFRRGLGACPVPGVGIACGRGWRLRLLRWWPSPPRQPSRRRRRRASFTFAVEAKDSAGMLAQGAQARIAAGKAKFGARARDRLARQARPCGRAGLRATSHEGADLRQARGGKPRAASFQIGIPGLPAGSGGKRSRRRRRYSATVRSSRQSVQAAFSCPLIQGEKLWPSNR